MVTTMSTAMFASRVPTNLLPPGEPVPSLARRIIQLLRVEKQDLVVDLCCEDVQSVRAIPAACGRRDSSVAPSPFGERLALLVVTAGTPVIQMDTLTFGRFPMRYEKVLIRNGFSLREGSLRHLLAAMFSQLDPAARFLIVDHAPSADAPLFAEGLSRWERQHRPPEVIAQMSREAGFSARIETVECMRCVSASDCYAWVESRDWPVLDSFPEAALQRGLSELRARYGSKRMVEFTSRFDLVLGTKPGAAWPSLAMA